MLIVSGNHPSPCMPVQENPSYKGDVSDPKAAGSVRSRTKGLEGDGEVWCGDRKGGPRNLGNR